MTYVIRRRMIYDQYVHIHKAVPPSEWGDWENGDKKGGLVATISKNSTYTRTPTIAPDV